MTTDDLPIEYSDIRDEARPNRDGTVANVKRYTFYLGKFGPFVERVPLDVADQTNELRMRVDALRRSILSLHL